MRMVRNGPVVPARIIRHDDLGWQAVISGEPYQAALDPAAAPMVFRIWHAAEEITEAEYLKLLTPPPGGAPRPDPRKPLNLEKSAPLY